MVRQKCQLIPSENIGDQRILESDWPKESPGHTQPLMPCCLPLMIISVQKIKFMNWFYPVLILIKESFNLIGRECNRPHQTKKW